MHRFLVWRLNSAGTQRTVVTPVAPGPINLLNDRLRINAAAGYGDINYRFCGIGNAAGDRDTLQRVDHRSARV